MREYYESELIVPGRESLIAIDTYTGTSRWNLHNFVTLEAAKHGWDESVD